MDRGGLFRGQTLAGKYHDQLVAILTKFFSWKNEGRAFFAALAVHGRKDTTRPANLIQNPFPALEPLSRGRPL